ncbi:hypothetical protein CVN68_03545 [Sphingomonas psychrotolerans]|uniref:LemA family protein n=1 Tax=Sphingomonas psychrotolerans TaxID=1327635 RepID=A0A2K8MBB3_9SPHN|nr:hypothetical protein CVN68_03545 [Sphingomonas psychrotolerans]
MWIALAILALAGLLFILIYNRLVRARALVREGWSGITVQLRRRADLVPNLVATVQGYAAHERDLLDDVTAHRSDAVKAARPEDAARADATLGGMLGHMQKDVKHARQSAIPSHATSYVAYEAACQAEERPWLASR